VILNDTEIEAGAVVERSIVDKKVKIESGAQLGVGDDNTPNKEMPETINTGLTLVGKGSVIPKDVEIGRNVVVHPYSAAKAFGKRKQVPSGANIGKSMR
jgi:glucose-1-phosphate adenylyltransferase